MAEDAQGAAGTDAPRPGLLLRIIRDQRIAFLVVGAVNTGIGYLLFVGFDLTVGRAVLPAIGASAAAVVTLLCAHVVATLIADGHAMNAVVDRFGRDVASTDLGDGTARIEARTGRRVIITAVSARDRTKNRDADLSGYAWEVDPVALGESIMRATWDWAEPGVLYVDTINRMNNLR